jgi:hypothetical protein
MKFNKWFVMVAAALALCASNIQAQTTSSNGPAGTIFTTIQSYLTTFNPAYSWSNVTLEFDTGYAQVTGVNAASKLNGQYDIGNFDVGLSLQFSGVGSAFNAYEAQVGYAVLNHYDTKIDVVLRAGYDDTKQSAVVEPGLTLKKKLTENTFAETAITMPFYFHQQFVKTPTFYIGVGFTY